MSLAWGVKRRIFLEGRGEKGREENVDRSEGRTIISGRNQKSFISSTLISTKVIPLARLRKFSTLILDYVAASKGPFFDLSPLFCFQTRRVFEGETFHSRSKFSSFFPSSIDGEKKFERGGCEFFPSENWKKKESKIERGKRSCIIFIASFSSPSMLRQYFKSANQYVEM